MNILKPHNHTLLIGIGNSGRADDGLGWAFLDALESLDLPTEQIHYRYQLAIEDASLLAEYPRVIFVDACQEELPEGFRFEKINPSNDFEFTTHILSPEAVLFLAEDLFEAKPEAYLLAIEGSEWGLRLGMSEQAKVNLEQALTFFRSAELNPVNHRALQGV